MLGSIKFESKIAFFLAVLIFIGDLIVPLGVAVGVMYVCCAWLLLSDKRRVIISFAILASALTIFIPLITTNEHTTWMAYVNRCISVIAIWITAYISIRHKKREEEAKNYLTELERKNAALEEYNYITSHDLQEPLRTISNMTNLLNNDYGDKLDGNAKKSLLFMKEATSRMRKLITGVLTFSKIGVEGKRKLIDCNEIVKVVLQDLNANIKESSATINVKKKLPFIYGLKIEIRMLFQNLISNAIKFRREEVAPHIEIGAEKKGNFWEFHIRDNGIGIKSNKTDRIFLVFQRLHKRNEYEGTGIGLSYCKKIVNLHDGDIWVESNEDNGSTFYFTIMKINEKGKLYNAN